MFLRDDVQVSFRWIDGGHTPVGSAIVAGRRNGAAQARREQSLVARIRQYFPNGGLLRIRGERIDVFLGERLPRERRRLGREWLRGRAPLTGNVGLGNGALFNGPERLARHTIEDVEKAEFGWLRDDIHTLAIVLHREEFGSAGEIVVPEIVMHDLEMPQPLARARIQGKQ